MTEKQPTAAELRKAQAKLKSKLDAVINDKKTVPILGDDGETVAVIMPYSEYKMMKQLSDNYPVSH